MGNVLIIVFALILLYNTAMNTKNFSQYFGGKYMKYWYVAFVVVMGWFVLNLANSIAVSSYELTAYDQNGRALGSEIVHRDTMSKPERLPITKAYRPVKPIKFLN